MTDTSMEVDVLSAARAAAMEEEFEALLVDREVRILDRMVARFRSGKMTYEQLAADVGAISELRMIRSELENRTMKEIARLENIEDHDGH